MILSDEKLQGSNLTEHVINLIKTKYKEVVLTAADFSSYRLHNGCIVLTFLNKLPGSAFQKLVGAIKSKTGADMNLYFNFMLTRKRSNLIFEI